MPEDICKQFEENVLKGLYNCGLTENDLSNKKIGVAVSGGADSISLLLSLANILKKRNQKLNVITINHNIRPEEETCGDAEFVESLCKKLNDNGYQIDFVCKEIDRKLFNEVLNSRKSGIEETARFFRYDFFSKFIEENSISYLCLAHNQNDQIETVLMRFFQGGNCESLRGIQSKRDSFIRPLLEITRKEIEEYLNEKKQTWRTDKTNFDINYLRNNIRVNVIPFLQKNIESFEKSIITGIEKNKIDASFINSEVEKINIEYKKDCANIEKKTFLLLHKAIKIRILTKMLNYCGEQKRIPFNFLSEIIELSVSNNRIEKAYSDYLIVIEKDNITVKKAVKKSTDFNFFDIINKTGEYNYYFGTINICSKNEDILIDGKKINGLQFPFCIRNSQPGDIIKTSNNDYKKVVDILYDWHVGEDERQKIPVVEDIRTNNPEIKCILGHFYGFNDWIVM